jgi:hypothetical protein
MSELADALMNEADTGGVASAEIPAAPLSDSGEAGADKQSGASASPEKHEKLSLRDQINKSVEAVRTEEAKRARAADGKFTKLQEGAADKPATPEIPKPEQNAQPTDSKPVEPPSAWVKIWGNLTPEAQALAVKREAEVAKGFDEYRGKTAQLQEISQALDPIRPILQQNGITSDAAAVKSLLNWEASFRNPQTRIQAFQSLAKQYGVDLPTLVQNPSPSPSSAQEIPEPLRPVIDQFGNIVQDVNSVKQEIQTLRSERIETELRNFAKDKPHFEKVRVLMGQLMSSGIVQPGDLDTAYQKATQLHPEVSAAIEAEKEAKRQAELAKTNAEKAARARQAAVSPGQRSPNGAPASNGAAKPKASSVRESLMSSIGELREGQRA